MKKFISYVVAATIMLSVMSCREMDQMSDVSSVRNTSKAKIVKDSVAIQASSTQGDQPVIVTTDPPVKDGHHW